MSKKNAQIMLPVGVVSPTPYDDVSRTMTSETPRLVIPLINEVFETSYDWNEKITSLANELFLYTGEDRIKRITDSNIGIEGIRYHLEMESTMDGTVAIRMFQYDVSIAIQNAKLQSNVLSVKFPSSAVVYLRSNKNTPDKMCVEIETPTETVAYQVEVLKVKDYTLEELFKKRLYFLIPFLAFNEEEKFPQINSNEKMLNQWAERNKEIISQLNELAIQGELTSQEVATLVEMVRIVLRHLTEKYEKIQKEVDTMGGNVIKTQWSIAMEQGMERGRLKDIAEALKSSPEELVCQVLKVSDEELEKAKKMLEEN